MTGKFQAAFFDMGETLYTYDGLPLSWKTHYEAAWKKALGQNGYAPTSREMKTLGNHMNRFNTREFPREVEYDSEHILTGALDSIGLDIRRLDALTDAFFNYFRQTLMPYKETITALSKLRARNVFIGALTDVAYGMPNHFIANDLKQVGIYDLIDCWKTSVDIGFRKPNPQGYEILCAEADCPPEAAIYVGNERKDIIGANKAGLTSILIHRSDTNVPDWGQNHTIHSLLECEVLLNKRAKILA